MQYISAFTKLSIRSSMRRVHAAHTDKLATGTSLNVSSAAFLHQKPCCVSPLFRVPASCTCASVVESCKIGLKRQRFRPGPAALALMRYGTYLYCRVLVHITTTVEV
jgi:hypothetical protein